MSTDTHCSILGVEQDMYLGGYVMSTDTHCSILGVEYGMYFGGYVNSLRCLGIQYATDVSRIPSFGHSSSGSSQWKHFPWIQVLFPEIHQFSRISLI